MSEKRVFLKIQVNHQTKQAKKKKANAEIFDVTSLTVERAT